MLMFIDVQMMDIMMATCNRASLAVLHTLYHAPDQDVAATEVVALARVLNTGQLTQEAVKTWSSHHSPRFRRNLQYILRPRKAPDNPPSNQMVKLSCGPTLSCGNLSRGPKSSPMKGNAPSWPGIPVGGERSGPPTRVGDGKSVCTGSLMFAIVVLIVVFVEVVFDTGDDDAVAVG